MIIAALQSVGKSFDDTEVLQDINLTIQEGERAALVGRSGSGKTTILRIVCGLDTPTTGTVTLAKGKYTVGYVPQSPSLLHSRTVRENILLPVRVVGESQNTLEVYHKIIATLGIEMLEEKYPYQLSRGQAQRVSLARGLILQPQLLVLDEPFASLDEFTKEELDDELLRLNRELGTAVLLVTHSIDEAVYIADVTYVLRKDKRGLKKISTKLSSERYGVYIKEEVEFTKAVASVRAAL